MTVLKLVRNPRQVWGAAVESESNGSLNPESHSFQADESTLLAIPIHSSKLGLFFKNWSFG